MATKLPVNYGNAPIAKGLWNLHQKNEYTHVDNYKEALCFMCWSKKAAGATLIDICEKCAEKKGYEAVLAKASEEFHGFCQDCGTYQFTIFKLNVRLCMSCMERIRERVRTHRKSGGMFKVNPFYKSLRRKLGKDWRLIFTNPSRRI